MKISISTLNYTIVNEENPQDSKPMTLNEPREVDIPESVVKDLGLTDQSYQEIGQYLVETLGKEIGHPISGIAWEVIKNIVQFPNSDLVVDPSVVEIESTPVVDSAPEDDSAE